MHIVLFRTKQTGKFNQGHKSTLDISYNARRKLKPSNDLRNEFWPHINEIWWRTHGSRL